MGCRRLLDREFTALEEKVGQSAVMRAFGSRGKLLTARTRSNDVLPAFCSPTMVTSISVALVEMISTHQVGIGITSSNPVAEATTEHRLTKRF